MTTLTDAAAQAAILSAQAASLSAHVAEVAAGAAVVVALIQLWVGYRQTKAALVAAEAAKITAQSAGRRRIAEFRQAWIYKVLDALAEYHAALLVVKRNPGTTYDDEIGRNTIRTKLEILLNSEEEATAALFEVLRTMRKAKTYDECVSASPAFVAAARVVLRAEWVRLKDELQ